MANKLPWMKHDHNARNDDFIKRACGRFGHFGYAGWFRLLEVLHEHGSGDKLCITRSRLASELGSKWPPVGNLLAFCRESGKVHYNDDGKELVIEVKNFRKKQANKHLEKHITAGLESVKPVQEGEGEEEGDKDKLGFLDQLKRMAGGFRVRPWSASELESHQFPFGKEKGRQIIDMEPSRCQWYLSNLTMDAKTTAALKHRIKIKAAEAIK